MTDPLDFSGKTVLVIGGSSGIGNGIAHGFRQHGALVHVTRTRAAASEYTASEGSDLAGLTFHRLDVSDASATASFALPERLDVVVLCQGTVRYRREEFEREGWDAVMEVNLNSLMDCARIVRPRLAERGGSLIVVSSVGAYHAMLGNPPMRRARRVRSAWWAASRRPGRGRAFASMASRRALSRPS